ncbi:hypothetical protein [Lentzea flava]|uniref:Uncharacterized protein n=1 Tax=Lentzea flava TaxID=103732 RepID=A0ABQ2UP30_9PSEU|nr:hypothetical protein [Lentzea flava]MCP2200907.1 hypothetical protein [Lentzea flava]GGU47123.1 hypothetical protein GCM10010178_44600 [Lentzea flava]
MTPEDVELAAGLKKISELMPGVAFDFIMGTLSPEKEYEFGQILITLGEILSHRAEKRGLSGPPIDRGTENGLAKRVDDASKQPHKASADDSEPR